MRFGPLKRQPDDSTLRDENTDGATTAGAPCRGTGGAPSRVLSGAEERGAGPPLAPERLASALIALDIGLALQHDVDPDAVPLEVYPELYAVLFDGLTGALRE